jgi:hypothetical protein
MWKLIYRPFEAYCMKGNHRLNEWFILNITYMSHTANTHVLFICHIILIISGLQFMDIIIYCVQ